MAAHDTDEVSIGTPDRLPELPLGDADVQVDIDEETYQRVHEEFCNAVEHGYPDPFDTFVFNHCSTDCYVTVDGERVDPLDE